MAAPSWRYIEWWRQVQCGSLLAYGGPLSSGALASQSSSGFGATDLAEEVGTLDIKVEALVKVRLRRGLKVFQEHHTSTWNDNVDFAKFLHSLRHHMLNVLDAASVTFDE